MGDTKRYFIIIEPNDLETGKKFSVLLPIDKINIIREFDDKTCRITLNDGKWYIVDETVDELYTKIVQAYTTY